ncbi:hypothetical protein ACLOJK_037729 [Asimina triloba]
MGSISSDADLMNMLGRTYAKDGERLYPLTHNFIEDIDEDGSSQGKGKGVVENQLQGIPFGLGYSSNEEPSFDCVSYSDDDDDD